MTPEALAAALDRRQILRLTAEEWEEIAHTATVIETHPTGVRGDLVIVRLHRHLAAVESPQPDERTVRPLDDEDQAREFVRDRLAQYERMWDGCGCRIDYDS